MRPEQPTLTRIIRMIKALNMPELTTKRVYLDEFNLIFENDNLKIVWGIVIRPNENILIYDKDDLREEVEPKSTEYVVFYIMTSLFEAVYQK